jgi:predicted ATPase
MIRRIRVQNYKALRDISLELTPVHALIGPNDSGKTSILNALATLSRSTDHELQQAFVGSWDGRELVWHRDPDGVVRFSADLSNTTGDLRYILACRFPNAGRNVVVQEEKIVFHVETDFTRPNHAITKVCGISVNNQGATAEEQQVSRVVHEMLSGVHYYRWNPRVLALPAAPESARQFRMKPDGFGLALCLDDILGFDRDRFGELERKFCSIFPEIGSIKLIRQRAFRSPSDEPEQVSRLDQADGKGIYFELCENQQLVPASQASDGVLLVLGYLAVLFSPEPPRLILVEEPENGIHPKRLQAVLGILRELVTEKSQTQVVFTTHSPYAVDLLEPEEVTLCTKKDGEVLLTRMADSKSVREQLSIFNLGEIWTAEGDEDLAKEHASSSP